MVFQIERDRQWRWMLALFGATEGNSKIEVGDLGVKAHFGFFTAHYAFGDITRATVHARSLPWYPSSIGWRSDFVKRLALMGARQNVVRLELRESRWAWLLLVPVRYRELFISIEQPDAFVEALHARGVAA